MDNNKFGAEHGVYDVRVKGRRLLLVGTITSGAITTPERYENFYPSVAHVFADGVIRCMGVPVGHVGMIKVLRKSDKYN